MPSPEESFMEAALSGSRRTKRELAEARLATARPGKVAAATTSGDDLPADPDDDLDEDFEVAPEDAEPEPAELSVEVVTDEAVEGLVAPPTEDAPAKRSAAEVETPVPVSRTLTSAMPAAARARR